MHFFEGSFCVLRSHVESDTDALGYVIIHGFLNER